MSSHQIMQHSLRELATFIRDMQLYPRDMDYRQVMASLEVVGQWASPDAGEIADRDNKAFHYFLYHPEHMASITRQLHSLNQASPAACDPMTFDGLNFVSHFIRNGLNDDWWLALYYGHDGERRIVTETLDDFVQLGGVQQPTASQRQADQMWRNLDKDLAWFMSSKRTVLNSEKFEREFSSSLSAEQLKPLSRDLLMELWAEREWLSNYGEDSSPRI